MEWGIKCRSRASGRHKHCRAAHTMKGVCQNLSLTPLYESASALSEVLRDQKEFGADLEPALAKVKEDYAQMTAHIKALEEE